MIRQPAVAGQFYADSPEALAGEIARCVEEAVEPVPAIAVVVPHAGYLYSGSVAGAVYSRVRIPERVVIVGVNHQGIGADSAIMTEGAWATPIGEVPIDEELAEAILHRSDTLRNDARAHQDEHSLEVQVPFLQHFQPDLRIVPIALHRADSEVCRDVGEACAEAIKQIGHPTLLVASTDLSHEQRNYERLQANDALVIERILERDPDGLMQAVADHRVTMCGFGPTAAVLAAANRLGATEASLVQYTDSYAVSRSTDYVVGYAGIYII
ncbi:MAG: AmmeMemoRadiSam system protein B [bacterium]|nr:AmmeMemoRadiSam system protein B [bacterium]